ILPLIAGAATFAQQKIMMSGSPTGDNPQMKVMLYLMPIMITVFAFFFPAALALYWVVGNGFMVIQTIFIRKPMMKKRSEEHTSELQSRFDLVCRLLLEKKKEIRSF